MQLQAFTPEQLCAALPEVNLKEARRVVSTVHKDGVLTNRMGLRKTALLALQQHTTQPQLQLVDARQSGLDPFQKYVMQTGDGHLVETVRIPLEKQGRYSVCVSSQVGCAMACAFCATGRLGLTRGLETWEIVEQVRVVRRSLAAGSRVHGVVFQGMGEPLANLDRVLEAIAVLTHPCAAAIDTRNITVCTSGLPVGIRRLAREAPNVRLGLSLGSARRDVRRNLMPIEQAHALPDVMDAVVEHAKTTGLLPMWAVTLLRDVNDTPQDAAALVALARSFQDTVGRPPRITLLAYNRTAPDGEDPFERSGDAALDVFRDALAAAGIPFHRRYSGGSDVQAACGQLAAQSAPTPAGDIRHAPAP